MSIKISVIWVMTLCSLIDRYQHFGRTYYFLVSWRQIIYRVTEELAASFFRVKERPSLKGKAELVPSRLLCQAYLPNHMSCARRQY